MFCGILLFQNFTLLGQVTAKNGLRSDLFISEYLEGSSNNKALEIYNPTNQTVDLSLYVVKQANNGSGWGSTSNGTDSRYVLPLTGTLAPGEVLVIANGQSDQAILDVADILLTFNGTANGCEGCNVAAFNGDDAIGLFKNDVLIDVIGIPTEDPGTNWPVAGTGATSEYTLVRKSSVGIGNTDWAASAGTNADDSEWIVYPQNTYDYLGSHTAGSELSSAAEILSFLVDNQVGSTAINASLATIEVLMPYGTSVVSLAPTIQVSPGATVSPASGVATDFTTPVEYTVTAEDGDTQKVWTVTITVSGNEPNPDPDLFISEYLEGSSNNKALEIYNPTNQTVDLSLYVVKQANNGSGWGSTSNGTDSRYVLPLTGTLAPGEVLVIANGQSDQAILDVADILLTFNGTANGCEGCNVAAFNGDDAIGLFKNDVLIDVIGIPTEDPGTNWPVAGTGATSEYTLVRKSSVGIGNTDWAASAGTNADDSEWIVYPQNTSIYLGSHGGTELSSEANILSFEVENQIGYALINNADATVTVLVAFGTNVTTLTPTITISEGATIFPASGVTIDFTNPVEYTVTAEDGETQKVWTVSVSEYEIEYIPIYSIQYTEDPAGSSPLVGQLVNTGGIVTGVRGTAGYYIQAGQGPWSGIYVYSPGHSATVGDSILLTATVAEYFNNTQLASVQNFQVVLNTNLPEPEILETGAIEEMWEGVLVRVENAVVTQNNLGYGEFLVNDGSGDCRIDDACYQYSLPALGTFFAHIKGPVEFSFGSFRILPRSANDMVSLSNDASLALFTLGGENVLSLAGVIVNDPVEDLGAILYVDDFTGFTGISIATSNEFATAIVKLNGTFVDEANYQTQVLSEGDVVVVEVTAEDGQSTVFYKVTLLGEIRVLTLTSPLGGETFYAGDDIEFTWTSENIDNVNLWAINSEEEIFMINENPIPAESQSYSIGIENGVFGQFVIRITDANDPSFFDQTSSAITIVDEIEPSIVSITPTHNAVNVPTSFMLTISFDEDMTLGVGNFTIKRFNDDTQVFAANASDFDIDYNQVSLFVQGLDFATTYYVSAVEGVFEDLSGNPSPAITKTGLFQWYFTTMESPQSDLFFSEYIEGSSNNKALEIYNPTNQTIDLSQYVVKQANNGNGWGNTSAGPDTRYVLPLTGSIAPGQVIVIANAQASQDLLNEADIILEFNGTVNGCNGCNVAAFNGDDAIGLFKNDILLDVIGIPTEDPGTNWPVAGVGATSEFTLVRKSSVTVGNTDWDASAGTNEENSEWLVYPQNTFEYIGWHFTGLNNAANFESFSVANQMDNAIIDPEDATVTIEVLNGTDLTSLVPVFTVSQGASAFIAGVPQVSGVSVVNFTNPVDYTVIAQDGTTKEWTVTITEAALSDEAEIISFVVPGQIGAATITSSIATVELQVAQGTDLTSLIPTIQVSLGASINPASGVAQNFTQPVQYTVTAQDGTTTKVWTVTISIVETISIYSIQYTTDPTGDSPLLGEVVQTGGIVTGRRGTAGFFLQAGQGAWSGIYVYSPGNSVAVGDSIVLTATVAEYYNNTQLANVTQLQVVMNTTIPEPSIILTGEMSEMWEGVLVRVVNATVTQNDLGYGEFFVNDGSGNCRVDDAIFAYPMPAVGTLFTALTGPSEYSFGDFRILPRSADDMQTLSNDATLAVFTLGGEDALSLTNVQVNDPEVDSGAILYVDDFTGFQGIVVATSHPAASFVVTLNDVVIEESNLATQPLAHEDVVVVTVTAEDGSFGYYKVTISLDNRELELTSPIGGETVFAGQEITYTWTSANIANVNLWALNVSNDELYPINDSPIPASLGTYTSEIENGVFGQFIIRITDAIDANFYSQTASPVTVIDDLIPSVVSHYPAHEAANVSPNFTLSITFDEPVVEGSGSFTISKLSDDSEVMVFSASSFSIVHNQATILVQGLEYSTSYYITAIEGFFEDMSGNLSLAITKDGSIQWHFTTMEEPQSDLFFSEYLEGSSNNKALEIYNPTAQAIDLSQYVVKQANNGNGWGNTSNGPDTRYVLPLTGTLAPGEVLVLANAAADPYILGVADYVFAFDSEPNGSQGNNVLAFNGDDAIGLFKNDVLIDAIGIPTEDPGTNWPVAGIGATSEFTLVRKSGIIIGSTDWLASAGTNEEDSEWLVFPQNTFDYLGWHGMNEGAEFTSFQVELQMEPAIIDSEGATITLEVLYGTDLSTIVPVFTLSMGATAYIDGVEQESGISVVDFTNPVIYTVEAESGTIKEWTVTITEAEISSLAEILNFSVESQVGNAIINSQNATVEAQVLPGTDLSNLIPTIQISLGATISPESGVTQDFTEPVQYTVTAQDGTTQKVWTVTVTVVDIIPIYNIQFTDHPSGASPYENQVVTTRGIVTSYHYNNATAAVFQGFFIQDGNGAWNGLYVYSPQINPRPEVGDEIQISGIIKEYFNLTELTYDGPLGISVEFTVLSQNNELPEPEVITTGEANSEPWEGVLIKVLNATCINPEPGYGMATINDGTGQLQVDDDMYSGGFELNKAYNVTGIGHYSFSEYKILPRFANDVELLSNVLISWEENITAYPNPFSNSIWINNAENVTRIELFNLLGQSIKSWNVYGESLINLQTSELQTGVYLLSITGDNGRKVVRKMIKR